MKNNTLKITTNFGNRYELAKARVSKNPYFNEQDWLTAVKDTDRSSLDMYISALDYMAGADIDVDKFYEDYNYAYADSKTRIAAITNEFMKDKISSSVHTQERPVYDINGNPVKKDGVQVMEKYEVSDYDYYKSLIKQQNDYNYQKFLEAQEQERKDSINGFTKFMYTKSAIGLELLSGFSSVIDGVVDSVSAVGYGLDAMFAGENFGDAFVKAISDDANRPFDDFQEWVVDFERRYTNMRNLDGTYTNFGKYAGGIATSVGQMLPSILLSAIGGSLGAAAAGTSGTLSLSTTGASVGAAITKTASIASQVIFYESMAANNVRDMYNYFAAEGISVTSAEILSNAAIKSTLEFGIERMLGKMMGGSVLDDLVFGRTAGKVGKSTNLTKNALLRVLKDAGQEGLEEVLQDTSTFLVDRAYMRLINENFGEMSDLTFQSLMDAFIIGAVVSIGGSAVNVLGTKADFKNKLSAWEYGLSMQSFVENYNKVLDADKKTKSEKTAAALTEMYAAYRIVSSIYGEIGEARFEAASKILDKITSDMKKGKFDLDYTKKAAKDVYSSVFGESVSESLLLELEDAEITELAETITRGETEITLDDATEKEIAETFKADPSVEKVVVSEDGKNVVKSKGTIIIPRNLLKNAGAKVVIKSASENDLVKRISKNEYFKAPLEEILSSYRELVGRPDATMDEAIRALLFDPECTLYKALLVTANKDMYKLLTNLTYVMTKVKVENPSTANYKETIKISIKNMTSAIVQYLKNQHNADYNLEFLSDAQKRSIAKVRWSKDLYSRIIRGDKISATEWTVLTNRVNGMNVEQADKTKILENLKSNNADVRANAMNAIDYAYDRVFTSKYDGTYYMPEAGIPNIVFNNYLKRNGLYLMTLASESNLTAADRTIIQDSYGEISENTILKYRSEQFTRSVNNAYTFEQVDGKFYVLDNNGKRVGYSNYSRKLDAIITGDDLYFRDKKIKRTVVNSAGELHNVVANLLKPGVDKLTANMLSITDVIVDSSLLSDDIRTSITETYGKITPETTFAFLREYILADTGDISLTVMPNGEYGFVNVKPMQSSLKIKNTKDFKLTKNVTASEIFKDELLVGMLADLRIILTNDDIVAEYRPFKMEKVKGKAYRTYHNAIYINRRIANEGGNTLVYALLHEFQHALQYENKMNLGMDAQFFQKCKKSVKTAIIADLRKHMPSLFTGKPDDKTIEKRVSQFIYHTSGESTAMGLDASPLVDFYPTIVRYTREGTEITFPWGSTFNLEQGSKILGVSIQESSKTNKLNEVVKSRTKPYSLESFMAKPQTCFVLPDGTLRTFDGNDHYEFIKSISENIDTDYWNSVPQIVVEDDFVSVKITGNLSNDAIMTTLSVMDTLYDKNIEFDISEIFYEDANPYAVSVGSDEADNADDLLQLYSRYKLEASGKMSLIKLADNLWEIESLDDLSVNSEIQDIAPTEEDREILRKKYPDIFEMLEDWENKDIYSESTEQLKPNIEKRLRSDEGKRYKIDSLKILHKLVKPDVSFEEFLNMDIPFARGQNLQYVFKSPFVSVYGALSNSDSLYTLFDYSTMTSEDAYLIIGTYKPKDILAYIPNVLRECLIPVESCINAKVYSMTTEDVVIADDGEHLILGDTDATEFIRTKVLTSEDGRIIDANEVNMDLLGSFIPKMSLLKPAKNMKTETEVPTEKKPKAKAKSRYLSKREAMGTPLEPFYKPGERREISEELKTFVKGSPDVKIPVELEKKLKDGTLTSQDVLDYFRNEDLSKMDQKLFELINKSYFHNDVITTPQQLQEYINDSAYYYAARAITRAGKNPSSIYIDDDALTKRLVQTVKNIDDKSTIETYDGKKEKTKTVRDRIVKNYYYKGKGSPIDISEKYAKTLWMRMYDGSLQNAGRAASILKWVSYRGLAVTGEIRTVSLDASIDEKRTLGDVTEDKQAFQDIINYVMDSDKPNKDKLIKMAASEIMEQYGRTTEGYVKAKEVIEKMDKLSAKELTDIAVKAILSEVLNVSFDTVLNNSAVDSAISNVEETSWSVRNKMNYHINKIHEYLPKKQHELFLKENSDLFTEDLRLRPEITKKPNIKGRMVYKDVEELLPIFDRLVELADDVKKGVYKNRTTLNAKIKHDSEMLEIQKALIKELKKPVKTAKDVKTITIEVVDDVLSIETTKPMPRSLERILDFEFTKPVKSRSQYVTNEDSYHFETNNKTFVDANAEYLSSLTQQDVDDIIDYYLNSEILKLNISESKYRLYNAVKLYMSVYLLSNSKSGRYTLTEEQYTSLEKSVEQMVSSSAQLLADWKVVKEKLNPEKTIINSLAKSTGVQFNPADVDDLTHALYSGDVKRIQAAKQKMYLNAKKNYDGKKHTFWDKLFQFERMAMLSGPGTWVRNLVSNAIIGGIYYKGEQKTGGLLDLSEKVGEKTWKVINKVFPKTEKWKKEKQYKITGTKVSTEVRDFIDANIIKTGLLDTITDGLSKYDIRKSKGRTGPENLTDMITRSIATKIFYANNSDIKYLNTAYNFIFKMLSDDKYVTRNMLKYLGKMLTEDNVKLDQGMSAKITDYIAEAYTLAAQDYMHKTNVWNKIDAAIRDRMGPVVYFAYKQFFPFAATSWNWFMEGLNYSPVGLINSIVQYAKLENTIDKLDEARRKGDTVISSRFAEYTTRRNIGKGVIGTIGTVIGILLAAFGVAKLDEEDDKYKLSVGNVMIDISDLFGAQGIFMGMAVTRDIIDTIDKKEFDFMDVFATSLDYMLMDSAITDVWTTIRYNETAGEWIAALPMQVLNNCVPNFLKTISNVAGIYDAKFDAGLLGKIEKIAVNAIPGLVYAMPKQVDIYTGEYQIMYKAQFVTELVNRLTPFDISPLNLSRYEKEAFELNVHKTMLSGKYTIGDKNLVLKAYDVQKLNQYYGELNKKDLEALLNNQLRLKVKNENGTYSKLFYRQMTEQQKRAAFEQVMSKNSSYAKVYILTSKGYKYYASDSEYAELRKLGITKNVYRKTNKLNGFVEP